jgi:4-hydroxybenzoate polyprenyltransferase
VWAATIALALLFLVAAAMLNAACAVLAPVALVVVFGYSYTKRLTWANHLVLGLALAIAPVGGWLAVSGRLAPAPLLLAAAVLVWVAGFDVIYACQDVEFDRSAGLHSIPARFGIGGALAIARALHVAALALLAGVGIAAGLHPVYWAGLVLIAALLLWEHRLLHPEDLSNVGVAFFNANGIISVVYLLVVLASLWLGRAGGGHGA